VLPREINRGGDILGGPRCHRIDAWGKHPGVDPAGAFRRTGLIADKERVAQRLQDIATRHAIGRTDASRKRRLNLDDRKATSIVLLVVLGVRDDGQKVLLAVKNMGGETSEAWRAVLDDLVRRGLHKPEFLIVDGGSGLEQALVALWGDVPTQRCTVHKHRNLLAHAPQRLHEESRPITTT
jgi:hypothetical protein